MSTGSVIVGMARFVRKNFVQDIIRIVKYVCEEVVVYGTKQLRY